MRVSTIDFNQLLEIARVIAFTYVLYRSPNPASPNPIPAPRLARSRGELTVGHGRSSSLSVRNCIRRRRLWRGGRFRSGRRRRFRFWLWCWRRFDRGLRFGNRLCSLVWRRRSRFFALVESRRLIRRRVFVNHRRRGERNSRNICHNLDADTAGTARGRSPCRTEGGEEVWGTQYGRNERSVQEHGSKKPTVESIALQCHFFVCASGCVTMLMFTMPASVKRSKTVATV